MNALKLDAPDPIQAAALYVYFWASPCRQVIMLLVQRYMRLYAEAVWYNSNESVRNFWDLSHGRALRDPYFSRRPHRLAPATPAPRAPWGSGGIRAAGADSAPNHRAAPTRRGRTPGLPPAGRPAAPLAVRLSCSNASLRSRRRGSTRGVATRLAVGPPARAHRRDEPDASPRRRSMPSVLRGCDRAGQGAEPAPASGPW